MSDTSAPTQVKKPEREQLHEATRAVLLAVRQWELTRDGTRSYQRDEADKALASTWKTFCDVSIDYAVASTMQSAGPVMRGIS